MHASELKIKNWYRLSVSILAIYLVSLWSLFLPYFESIYGRTGILAGTERMIALENLGFSWILTWIPFLYLVFAFLLFTKFYRVAAAGLICFHIFLFNWNPVSASPEIEFIGYMLFTLVLVDGQNVEQIQVAKKIAWIVLAIGYFSAGYAKWMDPSWRAGEALYLVLKESPVASWFGHTLVSAGHGFCVFLNYLVIVAETFFILSVIVPRLRNSMWTTMVLCHFQILLALRLWEVSLGMIVFHIFVLDSESYLAFIETSLNRVQLRWTTA